MAPWCFVLINILLALAEDNLVRDGECPNVGTYCSADCSSVIFCPTPNGEPVEVEHCSKGVYCNPNELNCTADRCASEEPPRHPFQCSEFGLFPDPYNCSLSYICETAGTPLRVCECTNGHYDVRGTCVEDQDCCRRVSCVKPGEMHGFGPDCDPEYYYICVVFEDTVLPVVIKCQDGIFNETTKSCNDTLKATVTSNGSRSDPICSLYEP